MAYPPVNYGKACCAKILVLVILIPFVASLSGFPTREVISRWADLFHSRLIPELDKFTGIKSLEKTYSDLRKAKLVKLDGLSLVRQMSADLTKKLEKKMSALENLVEAAEEVVRNYRYDPQLTLNDLYLKDQFYKMNNFQENDNRLVYSEKFKKGVNYSYSGVHIPVGIFEGYSEILNGLKWSAALDVVFKENIEANPDLMWQYFGSRAGFMRTYPAHRWAVLSRKLDFPDLYDVRLRPWYVHASSSPKDMLILMDISGSMHGQTMEIMKIAVKTLLTTLGENDFVNVASFNNEAKWITEKCFSTFVQANRRNKQILSQAIDELGDEKMASLTLGLEFAFKEFEMFRENRTEPWAGAECNEVIMLFSDGGTEEAWDVLDKYNQKKDVRVFAYVVGPHPVPYAALKQIACRNRGFFTSIPAMGAIRANIQDYVKVLARPLVLSGEKQFQWTNFYLDAMSLGMMTTVTLPVFNRTESGNQSIVGVMGIDISLHEMWDSEPSYEIGPASYSFGINRNGFMAFHPDLNTEFEYTDDPPHVDFLEVEIKNSGKEELRTSMINGETGKKSITSLLKMPDDKHIVRHRMEYFYTPLNKTSFTIAIVIPTDRTHNLAVDGMELDGGLGIDDNEIDGMHLAPWKYCHNVVLTSNISEVVKNLSYTVKNQPQLCKPQLIQRLLWDVRKTEDIVHYWKTEHRDSKREGVMSTFIQTEAGLTRVFPPKDSHHYALHSNPSRSLIFQRAFYDEDYVFLPPTVQFVVNESEIGMTTVVKSISFSRSGITFKPAVVGVTVDPIWLHKLLIATPTEPGKIPVSCSEIDEVFCYLVDDGGFVISTNQPDHWSVIGKFLGYVDSEVMSELYEKEIFMRNEDFNYEDRCKKESTISAGHKIPSLPFLSTIASMNLGWLFDIHFWSQLKYWLLGLLSSVVIPQSDALPEFFELPNETICNTHKAQYYLGRWGRSFSGEYLCNNCTRQYSLAKVSQTNLLLVVTTRPCSPLFCDPLPPVLQESEQVFNTTFDDDGNTAECDRRPLRYRRRPEKCYAFSADEDNSDCGRGSALALPYLALLLEFLVLLPVILSGLTLPVDTRLS